MPNDLPPLDLLHAVEACSPCRRSSAAAPERGMVLAAVSGTRRRTRHVTRDIARLRSYWLLPTMPTLDSANG